FVLDQRFLGREHFLVTDDALLVEDEIRALREPALGVEHAVRLGRLPIRKVRDQREVELQEIRESLLGKRVVHADADDFRVGRRELRMVVPTGRHFLHSRRGEIEDVELDDDVLLSGKIAQLEFPRPLGARQLEVRRFVAHFQRRCPAGQERQGESEHDCLDETESLHESPFAGKMDGIFKRPFLWPELYRSPSRVVNSFSAWMKKSTVGPVRLAGEQSGGKRGRGVKALIDAARKNDMKGILEILGSDAKSILESGDPVADNEGRERLSNLMTRQTSWGSRGKRRWSWRWERMNALF